MAFRTRAYGSSDVGRARAKNEDNFILVPQEGLYVVADGMGGHASGQLASSLAVTHMTEFICLKLKQPGFQLPFAVDSDHSPAACQLSNAIQYANERIYIESCKDSTHEGMGTTVVCVWDTGGRLVLGHAGDSRIYCFRDGMLEQVSEDHSLLNHLIRTKQIADADIATFPNKNVIFRALGLKDELEVDIVERKKEDGDVYLLCSDGLTDLVDDWIIGEILANAHNDLKETTETLIRLANDNGGKDNITVLLLLIEDINDEVVL
jgi:protein phosphatase